MTLPYHARTLPERQKLIFIADDILNNKIEIKDHFFDGMSVKDFQTVLHLVKFEFDKLGWGDCGKGWELPMIKSKLDSYSLNIPSSELIDGQKRKEPLAVVTVIRDSTAKPDGWGMDYEVDMVLVYDVNDICQVNYSNMLQYQDHSGAGI